jgi:hypothetical protein
MDTERASKRLKRAGSKMIRNTYCETMFSNANVMATQIFVFDLLAGVRERKKLKDEEDFFWIPKQSQLLPNQREQTTDYDLGPYGDVSLFKLTLEGLALGNHEHMNEILWLQKQRDGYSCAGASIFTCTAGYIKVTPAKVAEVLQYMVKNNPWGIQGEQEMTDLPIEGMGRLIYDVMGIVPTVMCGRIAQEKEDGEWEKLDEADNMFNDEERFVKMMRFVRFASICCCNPFHWYSLICIPTGPALEDTVFMVCDSLNHTRATAYPSYSSLRRHFFVAKTKPRATNPDLHLYPLTLSLYPVLQKHDSADPEVASFMEQLITNTVSFLESSEVPFFPWGNMMTLLDSFEAK